MSVLKRVDRSNAAGSGPAALDESWVTAFPGLHEYLTATTWADGKPRQVATLLILAEGGRWKGMVNDRSNGRVAWFSADTVEELLTTVDRGLSAAGTDWRASAMGNARGPRR